MTYLSTLSRAMERSLTRLTPLERLEKSTEFENISVVESIRDAVEVARRAAPTTPPTVLLQNRNGKGNFAQGHHRAAGGRWSLLNVKLFNRSTRWEWIGHLAEHLGA